MSIRTFSARDFTRDVSAAKRAAAEGPVLITDRGEPSYALLSFQEYQRLLRGGQPKSLRQAMLELTADSWQVPLEPPRLEHETLQAAVLDA